MSDYDYDFYVIGGGSGGLAAAQQAAKLGAKSGVADFVKPTPIGTKWGLGGTCVNVGCIPKKLMHFAGQWASKYRGSSIANIGFEVIKNVKHDWDTLTGYVQMHVKKSNFGYKQQLASKNVQYDNCLGKLIDNHTIELTDRKGETKRITSKYILIAVGGRPQFLPNIDRSLVVTSDDIFSLKQQPGKTLIVGASYIALETAGFLNELGYDVTVMVRSILLRGFDQEIAELIGKYMQEHGVKFIRGTVPKDIKQQNSQRLVTYDLNGQEHSEVFDTVLLAIGRNADTQNIGAVVKLNPINNKIIADEKDRTNIDGVFAIGDCVDTRLELTPTAIKAGKLLAARLFSQETELMDYINVPTTVFTPLEYGSIGFSEEDAIQKFGNENLNVYLSQFKPLEWSFSDEHQDNVSYAKIICHKSDNDRVVGLHYLGLHAGEVTQGFGVAIKMKATKTDFEKCVGIHPTYAEVKLILFKGIDNDVAKERWRTD